MPATFLYGDVDRKELLSARADWVLKRALGRVGDEVFVGQLVDEEDWPALLEQVALRCTQGEVWLAQRFVPQRRNMLYQPVATPVTDKFGNPIEKKKAVVSEQKA